MIIIHMIDFSYVDSLKKSLSFCKDRDFWVACLKRLCLLQRLMECTADNVCLLLGCELYKVNSVSGYTDGELRIFLRMSLCIKKSLSVENVYI